MPIYFTALNETVQFQLNLTTGVVTIVWNTMAPAGDFTPLMVGMSPGGVSVFPDETDLANDLPLITNEDATLLPLALSAAPAPVFTMTGKEASWT